MNKKLFTVFIVLILLVFSSYVSASLADLFNSKEVGVFEPVATGMAVSDMETCSDSGSTPVGKLAGVGNANFLCANYQGSNQILKCWGGDANPYVGLTLNGWKCERWAWYCNNTIGPPDGAFCCNGVIQQQACVTQTGPVEQTPTPVVTTPAPIVATPIAGLCFDSCIGQEDADIIARYFADASKYRADLDFNGDGQIGILDISNISIAYGSCQGNVTYNANLDLSKALNCIGLEDISILETRFADSSRYLADLDFNLDNAITALDIAYISQIAGNCEGDADYNAAIDLSRRTAQCPVITPPTPPANEEPQITSSRSCIDIKDQQLLARFFDSQVLYRADLDFNSDGTISILEVAALSASMGKCEGDEGYNPTIDVSEIVPACQGGCLVGDSCLPIGTRLVLGNTEVFCDASLRFAAQENDGMACQNDYQCKGNVCISGKCTNLSQELAVSRGLLNQILEFIQSLNPFN